jgi:hypothetical protein
MPGPWNNWYHVTVNTYGTWLRGDPRGFRTRDHREHVQGDYKTPPPAGHYERMHDHARQAMQRDPVRIDVATAELVLGHVVKSLHNDQQPVRVACLNDRHLHTLVRVDDHRVRHWVGRAKDRAAHAASSAGVVAEGGIWAKRCGVKPIREKMHLQRVIKYIADHIHEGAVVVDLEGAEPVWDHPPPTHA